ncbi:MAG: type II toxin-antitoxin system MqsA family antitoxin, partial [Actinomycetota bacterium]|nr:type II toxin-antitoxin system MqsA family antitoxin [Actinomycetota bacterium]
ATLSVCSICGETALRTCRDAVPIEFREGTFLIEGFEHDHCSACGEDIIKSGQMDAMQHAAIVVARTQLGRLTSDDIHGLRHDLGLTQSELERQLGVGTGTVGRWERGTALQSHMADNFMRLLWAHPELCVESGLVARESRGPYRKRVSSQD